jgi:hypothetical protein
VVSGPVGCLLDLVGGFHTDHNLIKHFAGFLNDELAVSLSRERQIIFPKNEVAASRALDS